MTGSSSPPAAPAPLARWLLAPIPDDSRVQVAVGTLFHHRLRRRLPALALLRGQLGVGSLERR